MQKTVLVHGHARLATEDALRAALGDPHQVTECWQEGSYLLTLATTEPVDEEEAREILGVIYGDEKETVPLHAEAGMLSRPVTFTRPGGASFEFLGVMLGHEETGPERYQP